MMFFSVYIMSKQSGFIFSLGCNSQGKKTTCILLVCFVVYLLSTHVKIYMFEILL